METEEQTGSEPSDILVIKRNYEGGSNNIVYLGLFMILLAFFIMLTSISSFEKNKTDAVIHNVNAKFNKLTPTRVSMGNTEELQSGGESPLLLGLKRFAFIEQDMPLVSKDVNEKANSIEYRLPLSELYEEGETKIRDDKVELFRKIAAVLKQENGRSPYFLELVMHQQRALDDETRKLVARRLSVLAELMKSLSVQERSFSIGISKGSKDQISLRFSLPESAVEEGGESDLQ